MARAKRHLAAYPKRIILIRHGEVSTQVGTQECLWVGGREGGYVSRYVHLLAQSTSGLIMCAKAVGMCIQSVVHCTTFQTETSLSAQAERNLHCCPTCALGID